LDNAFEIAEHVVVPKAQHQVSLGFKHSGSFSILFGANCVLTTIEFDD
jgi:hypothetical protein